MTSRSTTKILLWLQNC